MAGLEFVANSMNAWTNLACVNSPRWFRWCNGVGNATLAHFGMIPANHCLKATACLNIIAEHVHPFMHTIYSSFNSYFQDGNATCHKSKICLNLA